ncbi:MAG: hypothetical protein ACLQUY_22920, partial [Ktedonobacterales bacterium]
FVLLLEMPHDGKNVAIQGVVWCRDRDQLAVSPIPSRSVLARVREVTNAHSCVAGEGARPRVVPSAPVRSRDEDALRLLEDCSHNPVTREPLSARC